MYLLYLVRPHNNVATLLAYIRLQPKGDLTNYCGLVSLGLALFTLTDFGKTNVDPDPDHHGYSGRFFSLSKSKQLPWSR